MNSGKHCSQQKKVRTASMSTSTEMVKSIPFANIAGHQAEVGRNTADLNELMCADVQAMFMSTETRQQHLPAMAEIEAGQNLVLKVPYVSENTQKSPTVSMLGSPPKSVPQNPIR
jgi:hypothetical protein